MAGERAVAPAPAACSEGPGSDLGWIQDQTFLGLARGKDRSRHLSARLEPLQGLNMQTLRALLL